MDKFLRETTRFQMASTSFLEELGKFKKLNPQKALLCALIAESIRSTSKIIDLVVTAIIDEST